jgi:hypothetical protein
MQVGKTGKKLQSYKTEKQKTAKQGRLGYK